MERPIGISHRDCSNTNASCNRTEKLHHDFDQDGNYNKSNTKQIMVFPFE